MKFSYTAEIDVFTELPLEEAAQLLSAEVELINFVDDELGRFDDVPAFIASWGQMELVLFGPTADDDLDGLFLQLKTKADVNIQEFIESYGEDLFGLFPSDKSSVGKSGYIDATPALLKFLGDKSSLKFEVAE